MSSARALFTRRRTTNPDMSNDEIVAKKLCLGVLDVDAVNGNQERWVAMGMWHRSGVLIEPPSTLAVDSRTRFTDIVEWATGYVRNCQFNPDAIRGSGDSDDSLHRNIRYTVRFFAYDVLKQTLPFDITEILASDSTTSDRIATQICALSSSMSLHLQSPDHYNHASLMGVALANLISSTYTIITCSQ